MRHTATHCDTLQHTATHDHKQILKGWEEKVEEVVEEEKNKNDDDNEWGITMDDVQEVVTASSGVCVCVCVFVLVFVFVCACV